MTKQRRTFLQAFGAVTQVPSVLSSATGQTHDELMGKSIGLIGYDHIGREVASRAAVFGMRVFAMRQTTGQRPAPAEEQLDWLGGPRDLGWLLETADFVVVAVLFLRELVICSESTNSRK